MSQALPLILSIDCSDRACSVALGNHRVKSDDPEHFIIEEFTDEPRQHAKKLLPMYRQLLQRSGRQQEEISAVAVASGPGSFTGLRIGFSFAQGLSFALSVPLVQVSSLEALALSNIDQLNGDRIKHIQVCLDARMGELYVASFGFNNGAVEREYEDALIGVDDFNLSADYSSTALLGSGFALEQLSALHCAFETSDVCIHASAVHEIAMNRSLNGKTTEAIVAEPAYLRREDAWKTVEQQRQAASIKLKMVNAPND